MRLKGQLATLDLLILDELGYAPASQQLGTTVQRDQPSLRADQHHRHHEPAV